MSRVRARAIGAVVTVLAVLLGMFAAPAAFADTPEPTLYPYLSPGISANGSPVVGTTVSISNTGEWSTTPSSYTYAWYRDGLPIDAATSSTYTLSTADEGKFLTWSITAHLDGYQPGTFRSNYAVVSGPDTLAPVTQITAPVVNGTPQVGVPLTVTPGTFTPSDAEVVYWWMDADGNTVGLASDNSSFTPTADDIGRGLALRYYVSGFLDQYFVRTIDLGQVLPLALAATRPTVTGSQLVGSTLTAGANWNATPDSIDYQWSSGGVQIDGANSSTYTTQSSDIGNTISVQMTAHLADLDPLTVTATSTFTVAVPFATTPKPTISGTFTTGNTLTAVPGDWGLPGTTFTYLWYWNGRQGWETGPTVTLDSSTIGDTVSVAVIGTGPGFGPTTSQISDVSAPVQLSAAPVLSATIAPVDVGAQEDVTITRRAGDANVPISYTWLRDGVPIPDATQYYYYPTDADVGTSLSVSIAATSSNYDETPVVSNSVVVGIQYLAGPVSITGNTRAGSTVHADTDGWPAVTKSFKYEWFITDPGYAEETGYTVLGRGSSFTIPASAVGRYVYLWVQGFAPGYSTPADVYYNTNIERIEPGEFTSLAAPTVVGRPQVGVRLTGSHGIVSPATGSTVHYQWYSSTTSGGTLTPISGATASTYVPTAAMAHRFVVLRVVTSRSYFASSVEFSSPTGAVEPPASQLLAHAPATSHDPGPTLNTP